MDRWENEKEDKQCKEQHRKISLFVLSVDGILMKEDTVVLLNFRRLMTEKFEKPIYHVQGWVNGRIDFAVARS